MDCNKDSFTNLWSIRGRSVGGDNFFFLISRHLKAPDASFVLIKPVSHHSRHHRQSTSLLSSLLNSQGHPDIFLLVCCTFPAKTWSDSRDQLLLTIKGNNFISTGRSEKRCSRANRALPQNGYYLH